MSKHLYTFLPALPISAQARSIHMMLAYWGYVLLCIHAGTHLQPLLRKLLNKGKVVKAVIVSLLALICLYGIYAFIKRQLLSYMFLQTMFAFFDFDEARLFFILDYLSIMILFMFLGCLAVYALSKIGGKGKAEER